MKFLSIRRPIAKIGLALALVVGVVAAPTLAQALATFTSGTSTGVQRNLGQDATYTVPLVPLGVWKDVPTTSIGVVIPAGTTKMVESTFNAESLCVNASWCSTRVVYVKVGVGTFELNPVAGATYMFDSSGSRPETHTMHRFSNRLTGGIYTFKVQALVVGPGIGATFQVDDYAHMVDVVN